MHIYHVKLCVLVILESLTHLLRGGWRNPWAETLGLQLKPVESLIGPGLKEMWSAQLVWSFKNVFS